MDLIIAIIYKSNNSVANGKDFICCLYNAVEETLLLIEMINVIKMALLLF